MAKIVGLSRNLKLQWLNKVVELASSNLTEQEIKDQLNEYLSFEISSPTNPYLWLVQTAKQILVIKVWHRFCNIQRFTRSRYWNTLWLLSKRVICCVTYFIHRINIRCLYTFTETDSSPPKLFIENRSSPKSSFFSS